MEAIVNSCQRMVNRLHGDPVDHPPNFDIMMVFAAHFIGQPLSRYYLDHRVLCEANFAVQPAFELDILQAISDPYREAADFGAEIEFPDDGLPICRTPLLRERADLGRLESPDPATGRRMSDRLAAVRLMHAEQGGTVPVMGWVEGALAEAADLRSVDALMIDLYDDPDWVIELLERCVEVGIAFARAQVMAGGDIIGLGDAIASQISPRMYRTYALPYEQRIFAAVHELGALARLHICGNTTRILSDMVSSGADIIDIDWMVDIGEAAAAFGDGPVVCGNFDPVAMMLQGTPEQVRRAVIDCLERGGSRCFSAAGCEIPDHTPEENLQAQAHALRAFGTRTGATYDPRIVV